MKYYFYLFLLMIFSGCLPKPPPVVDADQSELCLSSSTIPNLEISPSSFSGAAGSIFNFNIIVSNNGLSFCDPINYSFIIPTLPSGFQSTIPSSVLVPSGQSVIIPAQIIIGAQAVNGNYSLSLKVTGGSVLQLQEASAEMNFEISTSAPICVKSNPTLTLTPNSLSGTSGASFTFSATLKNNNLNCPSQTYYLNYLNLPSGFTSSVSSKILTSGASTNFNISMVTSADLASANYSMSLRAVDANNSSYSNTKSLSFSLTAPPPPCVRANPTLTLTPVSFSGESGASFNLNATLKDNNQNCGTTNYAISRLNVPAGITVNNPSSRSLASGATSNFSVSISTQANLATASYSFSLRAANSSYQNTKSVTLNLVKEDDQEPEEVKAFPSAKGAGAYTTGGRGGQVIHVTTLNWSAPGGLRAALLTQGPRTIVFDVSGEIDASGSNYFELSGASYGNLTIAGQTAPQGGITIISPYFSFTNVNNVIIRYIRFRDSGTVPSTDAIWIQKSSNIVFDHSTFSHGQDEALDISYSEGASGNVTVQNCFFQDSKTGAILGVDSGGNETQDLGDFTFINNLFSNISHRFPNPQGNGHYDIINNVVYNWRERLIRITNEGTYNILNNYYKTSAQGLRRNGWFSGNSNLTSRLQKIQAQPNDTPLIYTAGNIVTGQRETPQADDRDMWTYFAGSHPSFTVGAAVGNQFFTTTQFPLAGASFNIKSASQAYVDVLNDVGANKYLNADGTYSFYRDTKDAADILMIQNDSFMSYAINDFAYTPVSQVPYPVLPQNTRPAGFYVSNPHIPENWFQANVPAGQNHNSIAPSGYTWLEEYLNQVDK
jgi:pectate lyase